MESRRFTRSSPDDIVDRILKIHPDGAEWWLAQRAQRERDKVSQMVVAIPRTFYHRRRLWSNLPDESNSEYTTWKFFCTRSSPESEKFYTLPLRESNVQFSGCGNDRSLAYAMLHQPNVYLLEAVEFSVEGKGEFPYMISSSGTWELRMYHRPYCDGLVDPTYVQETQIVIPAKLGFHLQLRVDHSTGLIPLTRVCEEALVTARLHGWELQGVC